MTRASRASRSARAALAAGLIGALATGAPGGAQAASGPIVVASVATKHGTLIGPMRVRAKPVRVKVGGHRCAVAAGTPLAALVALKAKAKTPAVGQIRLKDYGSCGARTSSSARLYVTGIGADRATGPDGWIYDVGGKGGSSSAADPAGPFGHGVLRTGAEVGWRWCRASEDPEGDCGDVLDIAGLYAAGSPAGDGSVDVTVTVKVRRGADGSSAGKLSVPPAGTTVVVVTPSGQTYGGATTDGGGIFRLHAAANPPSGSRIIATGPAGVAPIGKLWP